MNDATMVVLLAIAAPVITRVARRYSWSIIVSVVYKLWQWQTWWRVEKQNSDIRRVHGTRLTRASCWIFSKCTAGLHTTG
jgi:hypothetical protein